ncbi:ATP-binding protein [Microvirga roseola]|uniref:ATP-binding protein n=1 Tax=Microvirga roseola TaxID=2883126 RepID=UPI001E42B493|nr:ATP-binding protein [Microvirga roseola]
MTAPTDASSASRSRPKKSITRQTLRRITLRISIVVAVATILSYWHVRNGFEQQALEVLERYVEQRRDRESAVFDLASGNLRTFSEAYLREIRQLDPRDAERRFSALFETRPDGTTRLTDAVFNTYGVTGFIGKHVVANRDLKRRLIAAFDLIKQFGPAWASQFANLYVLTPEGAVIMYWPGQPWGLRASDWEVAGKLNLLTDRDDSIVVAGASAPLPIVDRQERWSELYFDYGINDWLVSTVRPAFADGTLLIQVGQDILMHDLLGRALSEDLKGTYNLLFSDSGELIAHPRFMDAIQARSGSLPIAETKDPHLAQIHRLALERKSDQIVMRNAPYNEIVALTKLSGPGWTLATIFPLTLTAANAWEAARIVLVMGLLALLIELYILSSTLKTQIAVPLRQLVRATGSVARGQPGTKLDLRRDDEFGELAAAFTAMARQVDAREMALKERSASLAELNSQLAYELAERERAERELSHHRELNALLETVQYGVLFLDPELRIRLANRAYREMWDMPADFYDQPRTLEEDMEESQALGLYDVSEDEWARYKAERLASIRQGDVAPTEMRFRSGKVILYRCTALPDGGRMLTYFDITELKRIEEVLRRQVAAMEAAMDGMAILTPDASYEYLNAAHLKIFGYDHMSELKGKSWRRLYPEDERKRLESTGLVTLFQEGRYSGEAIGLRRDGSTFPHDFSLTLLPNGGLICVVRDISERHARDEALREAKRHAEEASRAKSQFLANMSHELRTPLNAVLGYTELLLDGLYGTLPDKADTVLKRVQANGRHLLALINDVLDLSKIEAGELSIVREPYSIHGLIQTAISAMEPLARAKGLDLKAFVSEGLPAGLGDERRLMQVLLNLIGNAIKFTEKGSVEVAAAVDDGRLQISLTDTGIGITPEDQQLIFGAFQQGTNASAAGQGGTGLGLAISKRIVEMHGGSLTVHSEIGCGSTFTIDLPLDPACADMEVA